MRIAICTMGIVGGYDGTNGAGEQIHPRLSYESLKRKVIDVNPDVEFDIFIHTWSYECETWEEVLKTVSIRSCDPPSVSEEWHMDCPECGRDDKIFIIGRVELLLTPDGTENTCSNFADWDDNSYAHCGHCFFEGTVKNFKIPADVEGCNGGIITFDKENA